MHLKTRNLNSWDGEAPRPQSRQSSALPSKNPERAPIRVHDVVQVVVTPWSHFLQTATHCSISFGLYEGYRSVAHFLRDPVASCSGEHEVVTTATSKAAKRRMKLRPADDPMLP